MGGAGPRERGTRYTPGNIVTHTGRVWMASVATTGTTPGIALWDNTWRQIGLNAQGRFSRR